MNWRIHNFLLTLIVIAADQVSKWWVITQVFGDKTVPFVHWLTHAWSRLDYQVKTVNSFLNIVMVWNPGISFGIAQSDSFYVHNGLIVLALMVSCGFMAWSWRDPKAMTSIPVGLIVGGALGNVWDRFRFDAVADFIDVHVGLHHWPAFNVADSAVCVGVTLLLIDALFLSKSRSA